MQPSHAFVCQVTDTR